LSGVKPFRKPSLNLHKVLWLSHPSSKRKAQRDVALDELAAERVDDVERVLLYGVKYPRSYQLL
jgi:hypothetical protein